jgi:DNA ligase-1
VLRHYDEGKRSSSLLKVKTFFDAEAVVTGYISGKGRNQGVTGSLKCKMESGKVRFLREPYVTPG